MKALNKKLSHQMASTENEDCRCSAVQWIKGYSANFNLPVSVTNFQEACHAVLKGQAHDTRFLILRLDDEGTSRFIISVSQFDRFVESEILMCLFTLQVSLLRPQ